MHFVYAAFIEIALFVHKLEDTKWVHRTFGALLA